MPTSTASSHGRCMSRIEMATTPPMNATIEPTDRSMCPATMTISMPMARIIT